MSKELSQLMQAIGYKFNNVSLLETALCHRSFGKINNERLEFLGDSILNFIIAAEIFKLFPDAHEGQLSRLRANLVKGETLAAISKELSLSEHLRLGKGELKTGGALRVSILSDTLEAVICAIYLDSNFNLSICNEILNSWYGQRLQNLSLSTIAKDSKSILQEYLQAHNLSLPQYELVNITGDQHEQTFIVECKIELLKNAVAGEGTSRRRAEQAAAEKVLAELHYSE